MFAAFFVKLVLICIATLIFVGGFFALAGRFNWSWGWIYIALLIAGNGINDLMLWRWNPDLLARRGRIGAGTKTWDIICLTAFALSYLAIVAVGALDADRPQSFPMPASLKACGIGLFVTGQALATWSMLVNPFFEKTARLQREIGQRVVDTGPYRYVRHPGYTGTIAAYILATPLILGSWWAFVPAAIATLVMLLRTILEDRMLCAELEGYEEYCARVPNRLLPFIWAVSKYPPPAR